MKIKMNKAKFVFPVYYKSCVECDYDDVYSTLHKTGTCTEEKKYLERYNPDLNDLKTQDITIRGKVMCNSNYTFFYWQLDFPSEP